MIIIVLFAMILGIIVVAGMVQAVFDRLRLLLSPQKTTPNITTFATITPAAVTKIEPVRQENATPYIVDDEYGKRLFQIISSDLRNGFKGAELISRRVCNTLQTLVCFCCEESGNIYLIEFYIRDSIKYAENDNQAFFVTLYRCLTTDKLVTSIESRTYLMNIAHNKYMCTDRNGKNPSNPHWVEMSGRITILMNHIKNNYFFKSYVIDEDYVRSMHWRKFEEWIAELLNNNGYIADATSPANDGGKDIIARKDGEEYYIECKHWSKDATIGRELLQKLVGSAVGANVQHVIFIATCQYNDNAKEYAQSLNSAANDMTIELWDIKDILCLANHKNTQGDEIVVLPSGKEEAIERKIVPVQETEEIQQPLVHEDIIEEREQDDNLEDYDDQEDDDDFDALIPLITPEHARQIDETIRTRVKELTGMTEADIDVLEYMEGGGSKTKIYYYAKELARAELVVDIHPADVKLFFSLERVLEIEQAIEKRILSWEPLSNKETVKQYERSFAYAEIVLGLNNGSSSINITPDIATQIDEAISKATKYNLFLSDEEADNLRYANYDEPMFIAYNVVCNLVRVQFIYAVMQMSEYFQKTPCFLLEDRERAIQYHKDYFDKLSARPDWIEIMNFENTVYLKRLSTIEQLTVQYSSIQTKNNLESPVEIFFFMNYYEKVKQAYEAEHIAQ